MVAAAESLQHGHPAPAQHPDLAGLRPFRELKLCLPLQRRHRHGRAECRLDDRQVDRREDVVALADETRIGLDPHLDVDVARAAPAPARVALARDSDLLAVVDSLRNPDPDRPLLERSALAATLGAGLFYPPTSPTAVGTALSAHELAEGAAGDVLEATRTAARRTRDRARAGRGAAAAAGAARDGDRERDFAFDSRRRLSELDLYEDAEIGTARARRAGADPEEVVAEKR